MITVSELVEEIIKRSPFLEQGLMEGTINFSALARKIQPQIQNKLLKDIQEGAIVMALKRLSKTLPKKVPAQPQSKLLGDLTVRSNLSEYTFLISDSLFDKQRKLMQVIKKEKGTFLTTSQGVLETTLIASSSLNKDIEQIFQGEKIISRFDHLSSITISLPKETVYQPGAYYNILKQLAWEGINIIEVISSFTELTIILEDSSVDKAFSILKSF